MTLTHYVVIRRDLTFGEYSAQLAHAGEAYALRRDMENSPNLIERNLAGPLVMAFNASFAQVKGIRNEARLLTLEKKAIAAKIPHVAIREDINGRRLDGQLTCISFMPRDDSDGMLREFLNDFQRISALDTLPPETVSIPE